jgi:starch phosphorylase
MKKKIAYFTAEIGLNNSMKTFSGGLGILAGDTIKAMADLKVPLCAVTLLYKKGFFKQEIKNDYQNELEDEWDFLNILTDTKKSIFVNINGEEIKVKIWKYEQQGNSNYKIPIYYLDTDLNENPKWSQDITNRLYLGNRLHQEIVLGIGGVRALNELGENQIEKYHMNEGHSSFLTLELYRQHGEKTGNWDETNIRNKCIFTTHTPVPAGHDKFSYEEIHSAIKPETNLIPLQLKKLAGEDMFNTTKLAMSFSNHINAVAVKHGEVTKQMFPEYDIHSITNGIHTNTWAHNSMKELFDKYIPNWKNDSTQLKKAFSIPDKEILNAHKIAKKELIEYINKTNISGAKLKEDILTIGFARRFVRYKQADLIFENIEQLKKLKGKVQFIFSGKSHRNDGIGKGIMQRVIQKARELNGEIEIAFIENYDIEIAKKLISGCDLWLNTPILPLEASGTSGMKAAVNGCLHFSRLDGWAIESFEKNGGGFPITDKDDFFNTLEYKIIPKFYCNYSNQWVGEMKLAIGNAGSYFNTHRMAKEYIKLAYKMDYEKIKED